MAQFNDECIVVYQAYSKAIGTCAATNGYFGGDFKYSRMSWIKPNFLWIMYRSGWGEKADQEIIPAITLRRTFFDELLESSVASTFDSSHHSSRSEWKGQIGDSEARLQWDPDHTPDGSSSERRAIQIGIRGSLLERFGRQEAVQIQNISSFVQAQRSHIRSPEKLLVPSEDIYTPTAERNLDHLHLAPPSL